MTRIIIMIYKSTIFFICGGNGPSYCQCECSQKLCNIMFLMFCILVEIDMAKRDPFFHPVNFITCSYTVQICTRIYARLEQNSTLKYKVHLIDEMHFSQTSCHRHKRMGEVQSVKKS